MVEKSYILLTACKAVRDWLKNPKGAFPSETEHLVLGAIEEAESEPEEDLDNYVAEKAKRDLIDTFRSVREYLTANEFALALGQALVETSGDESVPAEIGTV